MCQTKTHLVWNDVRRGSTDEPSQALPNKEDVEALSFALLVRIDFVPRQEVADRPDVSVHHPLQQNDAAALERGTTSVRQ